jgi:histidine kinase/DNA gyrase B/HSP90-like ATPase
VYRTLGPAFSGSRPLRGDATAGSNPAPTLRSESTPSSGNLVSAAGEGIGLSIVKRLCELLDATLELQTAPGTGTTFRVILPRAYSAPAHLGSPDLPR